jgi:transcriptional regulator with GAF, ATPase, and Fis domain
MISMNDITPCRASSPLPARQQGLDTRLPIGTLSLALARIDSPADALRHVLDFAIQATGVDTGAIILNEDKDYTVVAARDATGAALPDTECLLSGTVVTDVLAGCAPVCVGDVARHHRYATVPSLVDTRLHAVLCVPMMLALRVLGALYLAKRDGSATFSERHMRELTVLAGMAVPFLAELRRATTEVVPVLESLSGESAGMMEVRRLIEKVSPTDLSVLIVGETGTGKEITARAVHEMSRRSGRPLIATNCSAIAAGLLEAELFGCKKGSFTGAVADREGRIEAASGSTLFLDEVGDMSPAMQAALLRALQEKEVVRLGENRPRPVDFRLVTATNKDLDAEVAAGRFREDLLFRLREVVLLLPPLRERGDDILLLARLFLRQCERHLALPVHVLSKTAESVLFQHAWPGNIRELRSTMRRAAVLSEGIEIRPDDLALPSAYSNTVPTQACSDVASPSMSIFVPRPFIAPNQTLAQAREDFTTRYVKTVLEQHRGNREAAAASLGISIRSLYRYLSDGTPRQGT